MKRQIARVLSSKWFAFPLVAFPFVYLAWAYQQGIPSLQEEIFPPVSDEAEVNASTGDARSVGPGASFSPTEEAELRALDSLESLASIEDPSVAPTEVNATADDEPDWSLGQGFSVPDEAFENATNPDSAQPLILGEFLKDVGEVAIAFFIIVLCLTPLRRIFSRSILVSALNRHRRLLGLSCFFYASFHLLFYFLDRGWETFTEEWYLLYILAGIVAFAVLLVMSATSNDWAVRKMGGRRWKMLHRMVYLLIPLLFYHKGWVGKGGWGEIRETLFWFSPLFALQVARLSLYLRKRGSVSAV